jgi:PTH2 family peptidyl-tRNA hydrolase
MRRGKEIAQGSHGSQAWLLDKLNGNHVFVTGQSPSDDYQHYAVSLTYDEVWWIYNGTKKVTLQISSEDELISLYNKAKEVGLTAHLVMDEGLTEFAGVKTLTALAIGPNKEELINKITEKLELY